MAKQTFTTGQVLTAAQMTSLQQTAMGGGSATAKTANYVLLAADAGTTVAMNAAGATTITVNTSLFSAGDTVTIQNLGAGICTITAGTATVNTSSSLALAQYEGGELYFVSASAAIFFKSDGAAAASGGANFTLLNAGGTTLSGLSTVTVSGISGADKILVLVDGATCASVNQYFNLRLNTDSGNNYNQFGSTGYAGSTYSAGDVIREISDLTTAQIRLGATSNNAGSTVGAYVYLTGCNSSGVKVFQMAGAGNASGSNAQERFSTGGFYSGSSTISSISIVGSNNFNGGTVYVYTSA